VQLELDPRLDHVDRYGRTLAYVRKGGENVNLTLVARGAASVWFCEGARGRYATRLMSAARAAKAAQRGLWKACPGTKLDPLNGVSTGNAPVFVAPVRPVLPGRVHPPAAARPRLCGYREEGARPAAGFAPPGRRP